MIKQSGQSHAQNEGFELQLYKLQKGQRQTSSFITSSLAVGAEMMMRLASSVMKPSFTAKSMNDRRGS